ncbi:restriction endonuclease subunit S [Asticcacaulis sp. SL142]|uniref:restriction endonuclease subunit S n=1 Tax=Asticcacaulis sp. SL142 TaxID=2995155 RepID=UPI00226C8ADC|nr:restriction endonuclease subunit S [Asticcacaulis sp. SL142]WAC47927.1 restriction endonuclease subunit S [Asticcacaulis sp. SL142]
MELKTLIRTQNHFKSAGRWDIDFHLPPVEIKRFDKKLIKKVDDVAFVANEKRDPTAHPEDTFKYVDIASIDISTGEIVTPQDLSGEEAPSRARKVIRAFDVLISTCRPTRGAISVVPIELHNQIASTAFTVLRAKPGVNPYYLHYAIRLASTLEQFRKWSTGSSYPAILDADVLKSRIPVPDLDEQEEIAAQIMSAFMVRSQAIKDANTNWFEKLNSITHALGTDSQISIQNKPLSMRANTSLNFIETTLNDLPPLMFDPPGRRGRGRTDDKGFDFVVEAA